MDNGWTESATAWIELQGEHGDWGRQNILDPILLTRIKNYSFNNAIDIGCGEGRFCRLMNNQKTNFTGVDPTISLIQAAINRDPVGKYVVGRCEDIPFTDESFDLIVNCLSLMNTDNLEKAVFEMNRILKPGGPLMIVILTSFNTAGAMKGWVLDDEGKPSHYPIDHYLESRPEMVTFSGIKVINWHRPLSTYMRHLISSGFQLVNFDEPEPIENLTETAMLYRRAPKYLYMEWIKPVK